MRVVAELQNIDASPLTSSTLPLAHNLLLVGTMLTSLGTSTMHMMAYILKKNHEGSRDDAHLKRLVVRFLITFPWLISGSGSLLTFIGATLYAFIARQFRVMVIDVILLLFIAVLCGSVTGRYGRVGDHNDFCDFLTTLEKRPDRTTFPALGYS